LGSSPEARDIDGYGFSRHGFEGHACCLGQIPCTFSFPDTGSHFEGCHPQEYRQNLGKKKKAALIFFQGE